LQQHTKACKEKKEQSVFFSDQHCSKATKGKNKRKKNIFE